MTTIGPETRINGRIEGDSDVVVEGRVDGTIVLAAMLTIAPNGFVTGDVEAEVVVIEGFASGTFRASQLVHVTSTAQVEGELISSAVRLDPGARLRGRIEMDVEAAPPVPVRAERSAKPARQAPAPVAARPAPARTTPARPAPARVEPTPPPAPVEEVVEVEEELVEAARSAAPRAEPRRAEAPRSQSPSQPRATSATPKAQPKAAPAAAQTVDIDPDELTVKELREMLTERGLPLSGTKTELVRRLRTGE